MNFERVFLGLVAAQALHSLEEYAGRLWEVFAPARFVSGLFSFDPERGFIAFNVVLVLFGAWCYLWPVRRGWRIATAIAWVWVTIELVNGIGHPILAIAAGGYFPGLFTAIPLLVLAVTLALQLRARVEAPRVTG